MNEVIKTKEQLETEGWQVALITGGDHLRRALETYQELGIEVYLEEVDPKECEGCTECYRMSNEAIYRIYTKTKNE